MQADNPVLDATARVRLGLPGLGGFPVAVAQRGRRVSGLEVRSGHFGPLGSEIVHQAFPLAAALG